jgi:hypothetical protein
MVGAGGKIVADFAPAGAFTATRQGQGTVIRRARAYLVSRSFPNPATFQLLISPRFSATPPPEISVFPSGVNTTV